MAPIGKVNDARPERAKALCASVPAIKSTAGASCTAAVALGLGPWPFEQGLAQVSLIGTAVTSVSVSFSYSAII